MFASISTQITDDNDLPHCEQTQAQYNLRNSQGWTLVILWLDTQQLSLLQEQCPPASGDIRD